ncbi:hypothetical protein EUA93_19145 [Nocardioides oleivorans]|uniref:Uncharacterized protein n=1 Tax=Nocardioides oleivorans TaxID=273676 RepID=A0A4Q2RQ97_9ACTN|nr:hypothetical protein [Nocardioides oleivorans]RYB91047.1 hypothetical protein EUA93_19145 [Nocardioides oleivorans]
MTTTTTPTRAALLALPGLTLAVAGLFHPHSLSHASAPRWTMLHVAGLVVFPLVGLALAALVRDRRDPVAGLVVLTAYLYATAYSALDVISGIGAGYVTWRLGEGVPRPDEVRFLFVIGGRIGDVGSVALIACAVVVAADALRRLGPLALPGLLMVPGALLVHVGHIFAPTGVAGMALVGLATGYLGWCAARTAGAR